jgi:hypothetical protein
MSRPLSKNKRNVIEFSMVLRSCGPAAMKGFFFGLAATTGFFELAATIRFLSQLLQDVFEPAATTCFFFEPAATTFFLSQLLQK